MLQNFHVMFKGYGDKTVFHREEDYLIYLRLVKRACEKYQVGWLAYALMSNHIHLVLCTSRETLRYVRYNITCGYAAYYRRAYPDSRAPGEPVFRSHNATKWLQANNDLKQVIRYVHRNLIEKGLEASLGENVRSSYSAFLSARMPEDTDNPFYACAELREIRDALNVDAVFRVFGKNRSEQLQNFIALHRIAAPNDSNAATGSSGARLANGSSDAWAVSGATGAISPTDVNFSSGVRPSNDATGATFSTCASGAKSPKTTKKPSAGDLQRAEMILKQCFSGRYAFSQKEYNAKNRQAFLSWLGRRGNPVKADVVLRLAAETQMSSRQIAEFLQLGSTSVKEIIRNHRK